MIISLLSALFPLMASMPTSEPKGPYSANLMSKIGVVEVGLIQEPVATPELSAKIGQLATVSAYTGVETCKNTACIMANGKRAHVGAVACPRKLALGTVVTIEGLGDFICSDRTAKRYDGRYDVFMGYEQTDYQKALQFGIQKRLVVVK